MAAVPSGYMICRHSTNSTERSPNIEITAPISSKGIDFIICSRETEATRPALIFCRGLLFKPWRLIWAAHHFVAPRVKTAHVAAAEFQCPIKTKKTLNALSRLALACGDSPGACLRFQLRRRDPQKGCKKNEHGDDWPEICHNYRSTPTHKSSPFKINNGWKWFKAKFWAVLN